MSGNRRMPVPATPLIEVFSSLQGEGVMIGTRQIFVRFAECNLACHYCDTPFKPQATCQIESTPGSGSFRAHENPFDLSGITELIIKWQQKTNELHHSLVLTGGEPLLHADILHEWLPEILPLLPVFLETNGTLPAELDKVFPLVDIISMDIKGASVCGVATPWAVHEEFLALAADKLCQVKLIIDKTTPEEEVLQSAALVAQHAPHAPFVLQPRTLMSGPALDGKSLLELQAVAAQAHRDTRIIPQIHPWLGVA